MKGITLVALVVTIIVLIILAGVSISLILGKNGIISKAKQSKEATRAASVQEQKDLWQINKETYEHISEVSTENVQELVNRLVSEGLLTENEKDQILGNEEKGIEATGKVTIGEKTIVFWIPAKTLVQAFKDGDIKVGDYLDYKPISGEKVKVEQGKTGVETAQTYTVDTSTTWRVLGLNEDETELMITSGSPIKRDGDDLYLHLASGEGYVYCIETLDNISKIYHNSEYARETRSMTIEDIIMLLGITVDKENNIAYKTADETKTPLSGYIGAFGQTYTYKSGDFAPENYIWTGSVKVGDKVNGTLYGIAYTSSSIIDSTSSIYEVLFKGTENGSKSYWLASVGIGANPSGPAFWGPGVVYNGFATAGYDYLLFSSNGSFVEASLAVRPIISLKYNATVDDIKLITGEESDWNTKTSLTVKSGVVSDGQVVE